MQQHPQMMQMQMAQGQQQQQQTQMGQNNPLLDLYLCANLHMKEQSPAEIEQVAVETLLRMIHKMYETPFTWQFIDKPRGGASAIVFHSRPINPRSPWPSDGIRYASTTETTTTLNHQLQSGGSIMIEKTTTQQGFYPPSDPGLPLPKDTRELLLARYRIRWRIISPNIGNPNLFFVYWGRDETNARRAPQGWEAEVIRKYPMPHIQEPPQFPLRPAQMQGQQQQQVPQGQQQQSLRPLPPNIQQIQAASRAGQSSTTPPQQMHQQQQQQPSMHARGPSQPPQMQPPAVPSVPPSVRALQQQVQAPIQPHLRPRPLGFSFPAQFDDPYEMLTERSWAGLRYERNHAFISPVFDPTTTTELLTSWKAPASIDMDQIKAQIASLDSDISKLKAKTLPSKTLDSSYNALVQPLPSMISITEMRDGAMQAYNLRRQQAEQEQFAKDEEERKKREAQEAEMRSKQQAEHAKFVEAQRVREEEERRAREVEEQAQRERMEQEAQQQQQQQNQEQAGEQEGQSQQEPLNGSGEENIQDPMDFDINNFTTMNGDMDDLLSTNLLQSDYGADQQEGGESNDQNYADDEFLFSGFANNQYEDNMEQTMLDFDFFSQQNNNNGMGEMQ